VSAVDKQQLLHEPASEPISEAGEGFAGSARPRSWLGSYRRSVLVGDLVTVSVAVLLAFFIERSRGDSDRVSQVLTLTLPMAWLVLASLLRLYEAKFLGAGDEEFRRVTRSSTYLLAGVAVVSAFFDPKLLSAGVVVAIAVLTVVTLAVRCAFRVRLRHSRAAGLCAQRTLVVCETNQLDELSRNAAQMRRDGLSIVAACVPDGRGDGSEHSFRIAGDFGDIVDSARSVSAEVVAVTASGELDVAALRRLRWGLAAEGIDLVLLATLAPLNGRIRARSLSRVRVLHVEEPELRGLRHLVKAVLDRVVAFVALLILWPFLLVLCLMVRATSPGPALFRQTRIGRDGHPFTMLKLRTMVDGAEHLAPDVAHLSHHGDSVLFKIKDDPRTTPVGRWLRRASLDELPQLINVVKGQMSLVGPRPPLPSEVERYAEEESLRLRVRPGLTGLWQVSGRSDLSWEQSVQLDLLYVENWSLWGDIQIIARTFTTVWRGTGAY
jgi:exopolysaccharide biosynthesis polyprenyl glycosylphosphotransferase